jgi:hypothetical protein
VFFDRFDFEAIVVLITAESHLLALGEWIAYQILSQIILRDYSRASLNKST